MLPNCFSEGAFDAIVVWLSREMKEIKIVTSDQVASRDVSFF